MIEVGVDVPEATVMVIEHAERFGLAQLHQLRGRIGRGTGRSTCLLLYKTPLGETAKARLAIMRETEDGFRIAEEDLKLRGEGDVLGTRQSGDAGISGRAARRARRDLLPAARDDANLLFSRDPTLKSERGQAIRHLLYLFERDEAVRLIRAGMTLSAAWQRIRAETVRPRRAGLAGPIDQHEKSDDGEDDQIPPAGAIDVVQATRTPTARLGRKTITAAIVLIGPASVSLSGKIDRVENAGDDTDNAA